MKISVELGGKQEMGVRERLRDWGERNGNTLGYTMGGGPMIPAGMTPGG